jgi:hypothetical protein
MEKAQWLNLVRAIARDDRPGRRRATGPHLALARAMLIAPPSSGCHNRSTKKTPALPDEACHLQHEPERYRDRQSDHYLS